MLIFKQVFCEKFYKKCLNGFLLPNQLQDVYSFIGIGDYYIDFYLISCQNNPNYSHISHLNISTLIINAETFSKNKLIITNEENYLLIYEFFNEIENFKYISSINLNEFLEGKNIMENQNLGSYLKVFEDKIFVGAYQDFIICFTFDFNLNKLIPERKFLFSGFIADIFYLKNTNSLYILCSEITSANSIDTQVYKYTVSNKIEKDIPDLYHIRKSDLNEIPLKLYHIENNKFIKVTNQSIEIIHIGKPKDDYEIWSNKLDFNSIPVDCHILNDIIIIIFDSGLIGYASKVEKNAIRVIPIEKEENIISTLSFGLSKCKTKFFCIFCCTNEILLKEFVLDLKNYNIYQLNPAKTIVSIPLFNGILSSIINNSKLNSSILCAFSKQFSLINSTNSTKNTNILFGTIDKSLEANMIFQITNKIFTNKTTFKTISFSDKIFFFFNNNSKHFLIEFLNPLKEKSKFLLRKRIGDINEKVIFMEKIDEIKRIVIIFEKIIVITDFDLEIINSVKLNEKILNVNFINNYLILVNESVELNIYTISESIEQKFSFPFPKNLQISQMFTYSAQKEIQNLSIIFADYDKKLLFYKYSFLENRIEYEAHIEFDNVIHSISLFSVLSIDYCLLTTREGKLIIIKLNPPSIYQSFELNNSPLEIVKSNSNAFLIYCADYIYAFFEKKDNNNKFFITKINFSLGIQLRNINFLNNFDLFVGIYNDSLYFFKIEWEKEINFNRSYQMLEWGKSKNIDRKIENYIKNIFYLQKYKVFIGITNKTGEILIFNTSTKIIQYENLFKNKKCSTYFSKLFDLPNENCYILVFGQYIKEGNLINDENNNYLSFYLVRLSNFLNKSGKTFEIISCEADLRFPNKIYEVQMHEKKSILLLSSGI